MSQSLRDKLVGTWELNEYCCYPPDNDSDKKYPMGPDVQGIIMYSSDGYMSAQLLTPNQADFTTASTESEWAVLGKSFVAYTGEFYLDEKGDEKGPLLMHRMRVSNRPSLRGDLQRRYMKFVDDEEGRYLVLSVGPERDPYKEGRMTRVTWWRMKDNAGAGVPEK